MDEGKARTRAGDLAGALDAYRKANEVMHVPTTGLALARTHLALGHLVEARDAALDVVRLPRESVEPAVFDDARRRAKELEASLKGRIPTVKINVKGGPATRVAVDDAEVAPLLLGEPVALNPGKHVITARNADGVEQRAELDLAERESRDIDLLLPAPAPVTLAPPRDDRPKPHEPHEAARDGAAGKGGGGRSAAGDVLVYAGFGLATAGIAVGTVTGILVLSKATTVKSECANNVCDPAARSTLDNAKSLATVSTIAFIAAGVGAAAGTVGLLLPKERDPRASALQWNVGPGGLAVQGSF
jgi:hypothetical protein